MDVDMPSYGVGLWLEDNSFVVRFPDQQLIKIPVAETGRLVNVLRHRESMVHAKQRPTVGTLGAPVQYDIDRVAEHLTREDEEQKREKRTMSLQAKRAARRKALIKEIAQKQREREGDELLALTGLGPKPPQPMLRKRA